MHSLAYIKREATYLLVLEYSSIIKYEYLLGLKPVKRLNFTEKFFDQKYFTEAETFENLSTILLEIFILNVKIGTRFDVN